MKIPVCPRCGENRTLKLVDCATGPGLTSKGVIRCMKVQGGCGAVYTIDRFAVRDSSGDPAEIYREEPILPEQNLPLKKARKP
jgi:hypothetical protein